jgi:hypothetical protein
MQNRAKLEQEFTQTLHVVNYDDMSVILKHIREAVLAGASVDEFVTVLGTLTLFNSMVKGEK